MPDSHMTLMYYDFFYRVLYLDRHLETICACRMQERDVDFYGTEEEIPDGISTGHTSVWMGK
jgi:hypothetical protein